MPQIRSISSNCYRIPLDEPLVDAEHGAQSHFELVIANVELADGSRGTGYTYTGGYGGRAIQQMIEHDIGRILDGQDGLAVEQATDLLQQKLNYVGRGGIAYFAISAVDIALWDLRCRRSAQSLWRYLGGTTPDVRCYHGGIDLGYTTEQLVESFSAKRSEGHTAFKMKLGRPDLREDLERIDAVRDVLGSAAPLMVDANAGWDLGTAIRAAGELERRGVFWLEEPMECRDLRSYRDLQSHCNVPIAMGENLHTVLQHRHAIEDAGVAFPQPDASNVCGITGWLRVAELARAANRQVCSHGMQELHVSLLAAMDHAGWMEVHSFPIDRYTTHPVEVHDGMASAPSDEGIGVEFIPDLIDRYLVS